MSECRLLSRTMQMIELTRNIKQPKSKNLVFSSVGNHSNLSLWLRGKDDFDLWISYYGDEKNRYREQCDFYMEKKGGKFPALYYVYQHWKTLLDQYDAILVMDDDIVIDGYSIVKLFRIRKNYDFWLLQPAFDKKGKISHPITKQNQDTFLRFTNFVENTCPLFRKNKLDLFMQAYDPILVGWGIDWWYMELFSEGTNRRKIAVVDSISCINPLDHTKGGQREILLLEDTPTRIKHWHMIRDRYHITSEKKGFTEYGFIKHDNFLSQIKTRLTGLLNPDNSKMK